MLPKVSLLDELRKGGYEASLITTFNAYLPFYEEVVLRRLVNAGVRHNVLMMDVQQYAASIASHPPRLAGRRYTLLPIQVAGAFHPKLIFLAGKHKGLVIVGSHNMTLAGFGFNRELTNVVRIQGAEDSAGASIAHAAWSEIDIWLDQFASEIPKQVVDMVRRVRDFAPWMKSEPATDDEVKLLAARPGAVPLWEQFVNLIDGAVRDVSISGAFFDQKLTFLKRVNDDLKPDRITVSIDPATVQIPTKAKELKDISLVRADRLGLEDNDEEQGRRYLHAKGIFVRQKNGGAVFASGSANPSRPAWLATKTRGNVEMMLVRRGDSAIDTAKAIGFADLGNMPVVGDADWQVIEHNQEKRTETELPKHRNGLAVVEDDLVIVDQHLLADFDRPEFILMGGGGIEIARSKTSKVSGDVVLIQFSFDELAQANSLRCYEGNEIVLELLLHHVRAVEEQARTGVQRRFKEALLSLETETPNIGLLIDCIDKIVFSEDPVRASAALREVRSQKKGEPATAKDLGSLAIDVTDVKKRKSKQRLNHSGDFAYLLDALIYHLRIQEDKSIEELDRHGRSEEEQIGADDEENAESERISPRQQDELLKLCHSKVRTLTSRIIAQLKAYSDGKQTLDQLLIRLFGVLAVLRELRNCDGRVAWVDKGKTTVPHEQRLRLLEEVMLNLFEGKTSLLHLESLGEEFQHSDDVARLKGLVLWLAWDCGLTLDLQKPFMEKPEQLADRIRRNAMVLALAQMISADDIVIDEARQSIGSLTSSELDWLKGIQWMAARCESVQTGDAALVSADDAKPGDIAVHKNIDDWDLRLVANSGGRYVSLVCLNKDKTHIDYTREHMEVATILEDKTGA